MTPCGQNSLAALRGKTHPLQATGVMSQNIGKYRLELCYRVIRADHRVS
jgi:hypothetical protein